MYKKILFITDGMENIERAINKLTEFHEIWGSEILVVHILKHRIVIPFMYESNASKLQTYIQQEFDFYELGQNILDMSKDTFLAAGIPVDIKLIVNENPEEFIKKLVEKQEFDLVVIGVQGIFLKKGAGHDISISKKLIKKIPSDVLIV